MSSKQGSEFTYVLRLLEMRWLEFGTGLTKLNPSVTGSVTIAQNSLYKTVLVTNSGGYVGAYILVNEGESHT